MPSIPGTTNYPTAVDDSVSLIEVANFKSTTLDGDHNDSTTTITVVSTTGFPSTGYVTFETECVSYTGKTGTTFTGCTRGADGTTAASHADNTAVMLDINARRLGVLQEAIIATQTKVDGLSGGGGDLLSVLTSSEVAVTGAVTLDGTAFGKMHKCSGTGADYTVGLPAASGNAGKFIGFRMLPALTKLVTLDGNGSEAIDGATTRVMWANETAILLCDGTVWTKVAGKTIPMSCWLYKAANQTSFPDTAFTLINLDTVSADNTGRMADTASNQIVVRRGGTYYFQGQVWIDANLSRIIAQVRKNGSAIAGYDGPQRYADAYNVASTFPDQFALAAGDTIQLFGYQTSGGTQTITCGGAANTRLAVYEIPAW